MVKMWNWLCSCAWDLYLKDNVFERNYPVCVDVPGAFVSVSFVLVEIATNETGLGLHDGIGQAIRMFTTNGLNIVDSFGVTVGSGYKFVYTPLGVQNIVNTTDWRSVSSNVLNVKEVDLVPNMTVSCPL